MRKLIKNYNARIPFSIIGVFLIIGSSISAGYIASLEKEKSKEISLTLDFTEIEQILRFIESDISRSLSYSGSYALKKVGKNPVIYSDFPSDAAKDYGDEDGDGVKDLKMDGDNLDDCVKFNINWVRNLIRVQLNNYIESNFMDDKCNYLDYIVNVIPDSSDGTAITNWRNISYKQIKMELKRNCGGVDDYFVTEKSKNYETYWEFSVPLEINLLDTKTKESRNFKIKPTSIITSRLPIMFGLTNTFVDTINGEPNDIFANKLAVFIGLTGVAYTEARALMMWSQGPSKIKNIVNNEWLKYLTNSGLVLEEFMVYNSVDAMSLIQLARNVSDFTGKDKEGFQSDLCNAVKFDLDDIQNDLKEGILNDLGSGYTESDVEEILQEAESKLQDNNMVKSVQQIAENILYEVICTYHYYRVNSKNEPVDINYNKCNPSQAHKIILSHKQYEENGTIFDDPDKSGYYFVLGKPDADDQEEAIIRNVKTDKINPDFKDIIEKFLKNNYKGYISTSVIRKDKNDLGYDGGWIPDKFYGDKLNKKGSWLFVSSSPIGSILHESDILSLNAYTETWKVVFNRTDTYDICTKWNVTSKKCEEYKSEKHDLYEEHIVEFNIHLNYENFSIIDSVYEKKNNIFKLEKPHDNASRTDDNLYVVREEFPSFFINNIRDSILESYSKTNIDNKNYFYSDGKDYKIDWIKAKEGTGDQGSVVEALEEILRMIKADEDKYSESTKKYDKDSTTLDTMDQGRIELLNTFINSKESYEKEFFYHLNKDINEKYISIGSKTIHEIRKWYLDKIEEKLNEDNQKKFKDHIKDKIGGNGDKFDSYEELQGTNGDKYKNALGDLDSIGNGQGIQIGLAMNLKHKAKNKYDGWSEDIAFALDREPNYFDFDNPSSKWDFNIKNTCWGGPTGIPLLPIPPIPWFCTVNFWTIDIDGNYEKFKLVDTLDETHADPLFGHDGQIFLREEKIGIKDNSTNDQILGDNTKLSFEFWVPSFAIVPPNRLPIGDIEGGYIEKN